MPAGSGGTAGRPRPGTLTVQGESAVRTSIPVVRDRRAAGGRRSLTTAARPGSGGWTVRAEQERRIRVPAGARVGVNFTLLASSSVAGRTDRRPAFRATPDGRSEVPPSLALIHLR